MSKMKSGIHNWLKFVYAVGLLVAVFLTVVLPESAAQIPVTVCPSCGGYGRASGAVPCVQCRGAGMVRPDGSMINGVNTGIRRGLSPRTSNIALYVCPSCGGYGRASGAMPCVQCRGTGMVRADGSMVNGVNTGLRVGLSSGTPSTPIIVCPTCNGSGSMGGPCLRCHGRGIIGDPRH